MLGSNNLHKRFSVMIVKKDMIASFGLREDYKLALKEKFQNPCDLIYPVVSPLIDNFLKQETSLKIKRMKLIWRRPALQRFQFAIISTSCI